MIGDIQLIPNKANSVTSVTHFDLAGSALKFRSRRFGAILPTSPLYELYLCIRTRQKYSFYASVSYCLVIDNKFLLQFFGDSPISATGPAFIVNAAYFSFDFSISIRFEMIKLLTIIVVGTAGISAPTAASSYVHASVPISLVLFLCCTRSATKAFNFFKYAFSARTSPVLLQSDLLLS